MVNQENCPAIGDKCSTCVYISKAALTEVLDEAGTFSNDQADVLTENSGIEALVNTQYISEVEPHCIDRQSRAKRIGAQLGQQIRTNIGR